MTPKVAKLKKELAALKARSAKTDEETQLLKKEAATTVQHADRVKRRVLLSR